MSIKFLSWNVEWKSLSLSRPPGMKERIFWPPCQYAASLLELWFSRALKGCYEFYDILILMLEDMVAKRVGCKQPGSGQYLCHYSEVCEGQEEHKFCEPVLPASQSSLNYIFHAPVEMLNFPVALWMIGHCCLWFCCPESPDRACQRWVHESVGTLGWTGTSLCCAENVLDSVGSETEPCGENDVQPTRWKQSVPIS